jgi:hypothetical protein
MLSGSEQHSDLLAKLGELHRTLQRRMREQHWDLHTPNPGTPLVFGRSSCSSQPFTGVTVSYSRSREQAQAVERMMGRDRAEGPQYDLYRHPVIELRLTPQAIALELVLPPSAWWDQRNFLGKLSVLRHRDALRCLLERMDGAVRIGFWEGPDLNEFHLTAWELLRCGVLHDWMSTLGDGQDWLRAGVWYAWDDAELHVNRIGGELLARAGMLYQLYTYLLWTSNNNYQNFYSMAQTSMVAARSRRSRAVI